LKLTFKVVWSPKSKKRLNKLDEKIMVSIIKKVEDIKINPIRYLERLKRINAFKLRVGDYRIIIDLNQNKNELTVLTMGHRKDIYKEISR